MTSVETAMTMREKIFQNPRVGVAVAGALILLGITSIYLQMRGSGVPVAASKSFFTVDDGKERENYYRGRHRDAGRDPRPEAQDRPREARPPPRAPTARRMRELVRELSVALRDRVAPQLGSHAGRAQGALVLLDGHRRSLPGSAALEEPPRRSCCRSGRHSCWSAMIFMSPIPTRS